MLVANQLSFILREFLLVYNIVWAIQLAILKQIKLKYINFRPNKENRPYEVTYCPVAGS